MLARSAAARASARVALYVVVIYIHIYIARERGVVKCLLSPKGRRMLARSAAARASASCSDARTADEASVGASSPTTDST